MKSKLYFKSAYILWFATAVLLIACSPSKPDFTEELKALADLQKEEQIAHLQEEPARLVNMLHDTLADVKDGVVSYYTKDEMTTRFVNYFDTVEFIRWEDIQPPVYKLSDDGTEANVSIRKLVEVSIENNGDSNREITELAWTELWKKKEGKWKMYRVTTTERVRK